MDSFRILFITGEASGDLSASLLCKALFDKLPSVKISAVGGFHLQNAGATLLFNISDLSVMGFLEPIFKLPTFLRLANQLIAHIHQTRPQLVILVDFPGFNLAMAKKIKKLSDSPAIVYLAPPQVWAWRKSRISKIRKTCDVLFPLFDFEHQLFLAEGLSSHYYGHILSERLRGAKYYENNVENQETIRILLCPGSRKQEIQHILPTMMRACQHLSLSQNKPVYATVRRHPNLDPAIYDRIRLSMEPLLPDVTFFFEFDAEIRRPWANWHAAMSKPGTVNLELAAEGCPFVVVYRTSWITYWIARFFVRIKHVSLINLLSEHTVVQEFIQHNASPERISEEVCRIVSEPEYRASMAVGFTSVLTRIEPSDQFTVAERLADVLSNLIKKRQPEKTAAS